MPGGQLRAAYVILENNEPRDLCTRENAGFFRGLQGAAAN
jgi:hypothetical protein